LESENYLPGNDTLYLDLTRKWAQRLASKLQGQPYDDSDEPLPPTPTPAPEPEDEVDTGDADSASEALGDGSDAEDKGDHDALPVLADVASEAPEDGGAVRAEL
jgi:hypothetical protein